MELDPKKLGKVDEKVRRMGQVIEETGPMLNSNVSASQVRVLRLALLDIKGSLRELRTNPPDYDRADNEVPVMHPEE